MWSCELVVTGPRLERRCQPCRSRPSGAGALAGTPPHPASQSSPFCGGGQGGHPSLLPSLGSVDRTGDANRREGKAQAPRPTSWPGRSLCLSSHLGGRTQPIPTHTLARLPGDPKASCCRSELSVRPPACPAAHSSSTVIDVTARTFRVGSVKWASSPASAP